MNKRDSFQNYRGLYFVILLLFLLIFIIYSNTFDASWHFDDYHNIVENPGLRISDLKPETIINTFFASHDSGQYTGKKLYRPIPCFTFALNWYFGEESVLGYHLVNILIYIYQTVDKSFLYKIIRLVIERGNENPGRLRFGMNIAQYF